MLKYLSDIKRCIFSHSDVIPTPVTFDKENFKVSSCKFFKFSNTVSEDLKNVSLTRQLDSSLNSFNFKSPFNSSKKSPVSTKRDSYSQAFISKNSRFFRNLNPLKFKKN